MNFLLSPAKRRFSFSFVRNPWDRAVSNWRMFTTQQFRIKQLESMGGRADMDFGEFLQFMMRHKNHHWLPQALYVPSHIDFVGRLETFQDDFALVISAIGARCSTRHLNKTDRTDYREYYDDATRRLVSRMYAIDVNRFGYSF
jgi:hypothetical protein